MQSIAANENKCHENDGFDHRKTADIFDNQFLIIWQGNFEKEEEESSSYNGELFLNYSVSYEDGTL